MRYFARLPSSRKTQVVIPQIYGDIRRAVTRHFPFGVFYLTEDDAIVVIAVMHASRDPARWQERA